MNEKLEAYIKEAFDHAGIPYDPPKRRFDLFLDACRGLYEYGTSDPEIIAAAKEIEAFFLKRKESQ